MLHTTDIVIPEVTDEMQIEYPGGRAAIVDGKFVACAMNSEEVVKKAEKLGYSLSEICITFIPRLGVSYI